MSFQHYHWKRSSWIKNNKVANDDYYCEFIKGSPIIEQIESMIHSKSDDNDDDDDDDKKRASPPSKNYLSMLNGYQDSILPMILSYTEYAIVPCTCCSLPPSSSERGRKEGDHNNMYLKEKGGGMNITTTTSSGVVVFCCRQHKRVLSDLSYKTRIPPVSNNKHLDLTLYRSELLWHIDDISVLCVNCGPTHGAPAPWDLDTEEAYTAQEVKYGYTTYLAITEHGMYSREMAISWKKDFFTTPDSTICFGISKCRKLLHIGKCTTITTSRTTGEYGINSNNQQVKEEGEQLDAKNRNDDEGTRTTTAAAANQRTQYTGFIFFIESKVLTRKLLRLLKRVKRLKLKQQNEQLESPWSSAHGMTKTKNTVAVTTTTKATTTATTGCDSDDKANLLQSYGLKTGRGPVLRESSHLVDMLS